MTCLVRCIVLLVAVVFLAPPHGAHAQPRRDRCVVLVSVDGLAGFYLDDPKAQMPTLHKLAREGARADGLLCSFPTVTWPNHTTLVTGVTPARHGVIGNNVIDRQTGNSVPFIPDPLFDKSEIVKSPTIYDAAHRAGLKTAAIVWPATRNADTLDWTVPDMAGDGWEKFGTRSWLAELRAAGLPVDHHGTWVSSPAGGVQRDWLYVRMAAHVLKNHSPNVLLIHLVETDHVQHKFGPRSDDAYWSVSYADDRLRELVEAIERSPLAKQTTLFVCSDHGFYPIEKDIRPNVLLRQLGLMAVEGTKVTRKSAICLSQGGGCAVYILEEGRRGEIAAQLREQLGAVEGVDAVIGPERFGEIGQPTREENPHGADLWLSARRGYSFTDTAAGDNVVAPRDALGGTHGYLPGQTELHGTCVVWGAGVEPGTRLGLVSNLDIAPTMAALVGIELPSAMGRALSLSRGR